MTNDANWSGGAAPTNTAVWVFTNSSTTLLTNGFTSYTVNGILFTANATNTSSGTNYIIASSGNAFTLAGGITNQSTANQAINTSLTITSSVAVTNTANSSAAYVSLGGALTGSGTITFGAVKNDSRLQLNGNNTNFSGSLVANSGRVVFFNTNSASLNGDYTFNTEAGTAIGDIRLGVNGTLNFGSLSGNGTISVNGTNLTAVLATGHKNASTTYSGNISSNNTGVGQSMNLVKMGTGTLTLSGTNTYNGTTTISNGVLQIGTNGTTGSFSNTTSITLAGGSLAFNRSDNVTQGVNFLSNGSTLTGNGGFVQMGSGTTTLTAANTYSGDTVVSAGALRLSNSAAIQNSALDLAGGAVLFDSSLSTATFGGLKGSGNLTLTNASGSAVALTLGNAASSVSTYTGNLGGSASLTLSGTGTQTLSGNNTFSGGTTLNSGTLGVGHSSALGSGNLIVAGNSTLLAAADALTLANNASLDSGTLTIDGQSFNLSSSGAIGGAGALTKLGSGTLTLTGANNYIGGTLVSAGTLAGNTAALQGNITNNAAVVFDQSANGTYSGTLSGTGSLAKTGSGTLSLTVANTYSGGTILEAGMIALGTNSALGSGLVTMSDGTAIAASGGGRTIGNNIAIAGNVTFNGLGAGSTLNGSIDLGGGTRTITLGNSVNFNGVISNGSIILTGVSFANMSLTASNSFGDITVRNGILRLSGNGALSPGSAVTLSTVGTSTELNLTNVNAASVTIGSLAGNTTTSTVNLGRKELIVGGNNASTAFAGVITNEGSLTKTGTGTFTLSGTNTYTGATTVSGGELTVNGSIAASAVTVQNGAVLSGSGAVGATTISSGATISPGNSPGIQSINGDLTWNGGGNYDWEIFNLAGPAGTGWDVIDVSDQLVLGSLSSENKFNINIFSLSGINPDMPGALSGWNSSVTNSWTIVRTTNGITGFNPGNFNINATGFTAYNNIGSGLFSLALDGNDLKLMFSPGATPIPEPGTWAAGALLALAAGLVARRRSRQRAREK